MKKETSELDSSADKRHMGLDDMPRYIAGKNPRHNDAIPLVKYDEPLRPKSELYKDLNWGIPQFNLFVTYTIDKLIGQYKTIFKDFIKLPSRKFHPQYYYKIEQPISINEIKSRDYEFPQGNRLFLLDIELLAKNCNAYNDNDSLIVKNSYQMVNYIKYEILKAKNIRKDFVINEPIKIKLLELLDRLVNANEREIIRELYNDNKGGRSFKPSEPFEDLVDADELPEYYEVIHRPMALNVVKNNLDDNKYSTIYDFIIDIHLIFDNCLVFNDTGTAIHENALLLDEFFDFLLVDFFSDLRDSKNKGEIKLLYPSDSSSENNDSKAINRAEIEEISKEQDIDESKKLNDSTGNSHSDPVQTNASTNTNSNKTNIDDMNNLDNIENLGNGYTKTLLPKDYYLPSSKSITNFKDLKSKDTDPPQPKRKKIMHDGILKYNINKLLKNEFISDERKIVNSPFKLIDKISIYTSYSVYQQAMNPISGTRPSLNQNWIEYDFNLKTLNQYENNFAFTVDALQTYLTVSMKLSASNLINSLHLNNDLIQSTNMPDDTSSTGQNTNSNNSNNMHHKFEIKLNEGLNCLELKSSTDTSDDMETFKVWINVLP